MAASPLRIYLLTDLPNDRLIPLRQPARLVRIVAFLHDGALTVRHFARFQIFPRQRVESMLGFFMPKPKSSNTRNEERKAEIRIIREFADRLIREGKAKEFLVENGFVKQTGGLTKRYGG